MKLYKCIPYLILAAMACYNGSRSRIEGTVLDVSYSNATTTEPRPTVRFETVGGGTLEFKLDKWGKHPLKKGDTTAVDTFTEFFVFEKTLVGQRAQ